VAHLAGSSISCWLGIAEDFFNGDIAAVIKGKVQIILNVHERCGGA